MPIADGSPGTVLRENGFGMAASAGVTAAARITAAPAASASVRTAMPPRRAELT